MAISRTTAKKAILPFTGLLVGIWWFAFNLSLPPEQRGVTCCDAAGYIGNATVADTWNFVGHRTFGYAWFLSLFLRGYAWLGGTVQNGWIPAAMTAQLAIWFVSVSVFFSFMKRVSMWHSPLLLALLYAHPAFSAQSAITLTDSLATSLFCLSMACLVLIQQRTERLALPCLGLGFTLGLEVTIRPSFEMISAATLVVLAVYLFARAAVNRQGIRRALAATTVGTLAFLIGFLPGYGKTIKNCYAVHGQFCKFDPEFMRTVSKQIPLLSLTAVRWWSSGTIGFRNTEDPFVWDMAHICEVPKGTPETGVARWILQCYLKAPWHSPIVIGKKLISGFDNYFLNSYATDETTPRQRVFNRTFSLVSFLGFVFAAGTVLTSIFRRSIFDYLYLIIPLIYVALQVNFHVETRYYFPTYPVFFLFFFDRFCTALHGSWMRRIRFGTATAALITLFLYQTMYWDLRDCWVDQNHIMPEKPRYGLMAACQPKESIDYRYRNYFSWLPEWPPHSQ